MSRVGRFLVLLAVLSLCSGCVLDYISAKLNDPGLVRTGVHPKAKQVEDDLDWGLMGP